MLEVLTPLVSENTGTTKSLSKVQAEKLAGYEIEFSSYGLPGVPCVYVLFDETTNISYVGQTKNLRLRMGGHRKTFGSMWVAYKVIEDIEDRMRFESREIGRLKPCRNRTHRVNLEDSQEFITDVQKSAEVLAVGGSAISWSGFNLYGDKKSVDEVHRLMYVESVVHELRSRLNSAMSKCAPSIEAIKETHK